MFDFIDGGGLDLSFLGLAQCDDRGNVNVSRFGEKVAGCGGFIDISQNVKNMVFCGTFTAGGLAAEIREGRLKIVREGKTKKFIKSLRQVTFSADMALEQGRNVYFVTERAVFKLVKGGLLLFEYAPGTNIDRDILAQMEFKPLIAEDIKEMDPVIFRDGY